MTANSGEVVTAGTTDATQLTVTNKPTQSEILTFFINVISGTVKFGINSIGANAYGYTSADGNIIFECRREELYFQAASGADTFRIV